MARKRGVYILYEHVKDQQVILLLTPVGRVAMDAKVKAYRDPLGRKLSRSEYFERWARGLL